MTGSFHDGLVAVREGLRRDDWVIINRPRWHQIPEKVVPEQVPMPSGSGRDVSGHALISGRLRARLRSRT